MNLVANFWPFVLKSVIIENLMQANCKICCGFMTICSDEWES